eukprot:1932478-Ditylum_brightwellii.AAC.1
MIKQADSTAIICLHDSDNLKGALITPNDIPIPKGGETYPGVRIAIDGSRGKLEECTEFDLRAQVVHMWFCTIQSRSIVKGFYLLNFSPDANLKFWTEFFKKHIYELTLKDEYASDLPHASIRIDLKCHSLFYGYKRNPNASTWSSRHNLTVHVELEASMEELGSTYLSNILKDLEFSGMYGETVRSTVHKLKVQKRGSESVKFSTR